MDLRNCLAMDGGEDDPRGQVELDEGAGAPGVVVVVGEVHGRELHDRGVADVAYRYTNSISTNSSLAELDTS